MGLAYGTYLSANNWYQHDSYSTMFLLSSTRLVSFPPPAQLPPLCYYAAALVYKYLVSHWLHPVSEKTRSFISTYTVPGFHLHIPIAGFLSTGHIPLHFVVNLFIWFRWVNTEPRDHTSFSFFLGLKFIFLITIAEISPGIGSKIIFSRSALRFLSFFTWPSTEQFMISNITSRRATYQLSMSVEVTGTKTLWWQEVYKAQIWL